MALFDLIIDAEAIIIISVILHFSLFYMYILVHKKKLLEYINNLL